MNTVQITTYDERINRVCEYIYQNLNEELTLDLLSDVAAFSKCHFHRVFSASVGISVIKFIQLSRLKRASFHLAFKVDMRVIDIALEAGFDSPEAFSRAFKRTFGLSPTQFRTFPEWPSWHSKFKFNLPTKEMKKMNIEIINLKETKVALIQHKGSPELVYNTAAKFIAWRKEYQLSPIKSSKTYGVPYSDPKTTAPEEFRFDICGSINEEIPNNDYGVKSGIIPGGRCAVIRHQGSHDNMDDSIYYLYSEWLPKSGEEVRNFPCYFRYLNFVHDVDECDLLTDIYLPIK